MNHHKFSPPPYFITSFINFKVHLWGHWQNAVLSGSSMNLQPNITNSFWAKEKMKRNISVKENFRKLPSPFIVEPAKTSIMAWWLKSHTAVPNARKMCACIVYCTLWRTTKKWGKFSPNFRSRKIINMNLLRRKATKWKKFLNMVFSLICQEIEKITISSKLFQKTVKLHYWR